MSDGNGGHNAALDDLVGQFPRRPVGNRTPGLFGRLTGDRQDLSDLLGGELAAAPRPRQVAENLFHGVSEDRRFLQALDDGQLGKGLLPASPPAADPVPLALEFFGDRFVGETVKGEQEDFGAVGQSLGSGSRKGQFLKHLLLTFGNDHFGRLPWHDLISSRTIWHRIKKMAYYARGWKPDSGAALDFGVGKW